MKEIIALNHGIDPKKVEEKQTILIPGGKLSSRDKEILAGQLASFSFQIFLGFCQGLCSTPAACCKQIDL